MADNQAKVPGKVEKMTPSTLQPWRPFESFRREVDRLFDDFSGGLWRFAIRPFVFRYRRSGGPKRHSARYR
jgi:hypothetical protein